MHFLQQYACVHAVSAPSSLFHNAPPAAALFVSCRNPVKPDYTYLARITSGYAARGSRQLSVDNVGRFKPGQWVRLVLQDSSEWAAAATAVLV
jgi:hypothetical protein